MTTKQRRYGGKSGEERKAERRERLLSAGLDIVLDRGAAKLTVTGVCQAAGLSERYFYESFKDRTTLLDAIFAGIAQSGVTAIIEAALEANTPESRARTVVTKLVELMLDDERLSLVARDFRTDETVMRGRAATAHRLAVAFEEHAAVFWEIDGATPTEIRARALAAVGGLADLLVAWQVGDLELERGEAIAIASGFLLAAGNPAKAPAR
ncbi:TetR/AcrR family transcriptional regulator [Paraconexibacter algicola]|uniref:TetR/AcrR family transcriptional regulator n=1 Tax=Paraconexibacter algicola TaxID=2133960 RepID=A0A2T4UL18_9ACTN|nr:TetR/AcrR family transcriptional regulator [Paraconexibacter algicola]PTL59939.1 TetR/AcrR family transcriptional regulator [Paraconexibacter algicola]